MKHRDRIRATGGLAFLLALASGPTVAAETFCVRYGSPGFERSIQAAIDKAADGDEIRVCFEDPLVAYRETLLIDKAVRIVGYDPRQDGRPVEIRKRFRAGDHTPIVTITAAATLENFIIRYDDPVPGEPNWRSQPPPYPGVVIRGPGRLVNCSVGFCGVGVVFEGGRGSGPVPELRDCSVGRARPGKPELSRMLPNHYGILDRGADPAPLIEHCHIRENGGIGLVLSGGSQAVVCNDLIVGNGLGILSELSLAAADPAGDRVQAPVIARCTISDNSGRGIEFRLAGAPTPASGQRLHAGLVRDCLIAGNRGAGLAWTGSAAAGGGPVAPIRPVVDANLIWGNGGGRDLLDPPPGWQATLTLNEDPRAIEPWPGFEGEGDACGSAVP